MRRPSHAGTAAAAAAGGGARDRGDGPTAASDADVIGLVTGGGGRRRGRRRRRPPRTSVTVVAMGRERAGARRRARRQGRREPGGARGPRVSAWVGRPAQAHTPPGRRADPPSTRRPRRRRADRGRTTQMGAASGRGWRCGRRSFERPLPRAAAPWRPTTGHGARAASGGRARRVGQWGAASGGRARRLAVGRGVWRPTGGMRAPRPPSTPLPPARPSALAARVRYGVRRGTTPAPSDRGACAPLAAGGPRHCGACAGCRCGRADRVRGGCAWRRVQGMGPVVRGRTLSAADPPGRGGGCWERHLPKRSTTPSIGVEGG